MEAELLIESTSLILSSLIKIDNLPLLVSSSVVAPNTNWVTFLILGTLDIKDLVVSPVDELVVLVLEKLEPSLVGAPDLHVIGSTSILDVP
jgi:hypothetical protein